MRNNYRIALFALLALCLTACIKEGYDSDNCPGEFVIIPAYPDGEAGGGEGTQTIITKPDGSKEQVEIGSDHPLDLEEGTHTVTSTQGKTDNLTVDGSIVTIETDEEGNPKEPGDFAGGYVDITVGPNGESGSTSYEVPVNRQTRPLIIKVKLVGNNVPMVKGMAGTVSGIAFSRNLNHGFLPTDGQPRHPALTSGTVPYSFEKSETTTGGQDFLSETRRLLGIDGDAEQQLTLDILFGNNTYMRYEFDITRAMDEFHITDVSKPWTIEITIRLGADFSATIEDWKAGPDIWMDAEHESDPRK